MTCPESSRMIDMPESKTETNTPRVRRRRKRMNKPSTTNDATPATSAELAVVAETETAWDGFAKVDCECDAALYGLFLG